MSRRKISLPAIGLLLGAFVIIGITPVVGALEDTTEPQEPATRLDNRAEELQRRQSALEKKKQEQQRKEQERKDRRIKTCEAKAEGINTAFTKITENRRRIYTRLTEISDKVQAFVSTKQLAVENYDNLVAAIDQRRATAEASINQVHASSTLSCNDVRTPKDQLQAFREKRKGSIDALKEYRGAIKRLVLAVKATISSEKGLEGRHEGATQ